ncbi:MAG: hypothetical protein HQL86_06905 [Magnetococcales bacterium]|nr:hypothetical protein [Magnetococcales bacterium]
MEMVAGETGSVDLRVQRRQSADSAACIGGQATMVSSVFWRVTSLVAGMSSRMAWIDAVHSRRPGNIVVLDMDSSVSPTYGG